MTMQNKTMTCALVAVVLGVLLAAASPATYAFAIGGDGSGAGDGSGGSAVAITTDRPGISVEGAYVRGGDGPLGVEGEETVDVSPTPSYDEHIWKFALLFDQNVAYTPAKLVEDQEFLAANAAKVHLRRADSGEDVPFAHGIAQNIREDRNLLGVIVGDWLDPLTEYELVAEPGIVTASGADELKEPFIVKFKTSGLTRYGFTVQEFATAVLVIVVFAVGVAVGVVRMRKRFSR